jgi:hypothetical protein
MIRKSILLGLFIVLSLTGIVSANGLNGSCGMGNMMYGSHGVGGMFFGWTIAGLFIVLLVLLIIWLIKQIQKK